MGMAYDDFVRLTLDEFEAVADAWAKSRELEAKEQWERVRVHAAVTVQPHVKTRLTPTKLMPLPWDKALGREKHVEELTPEQRIERFKALVANEHKH